MTKRSTPRPDKTKRAAAPTKTTKNPAAARPRKIAQDVELRSLASLTPDPQNARAHSPTNIGMIADSLQAVGAARSIVIDEHNVVIAGNGVVEAAGQVGLERVRVIDATGDEIIAVRRRGLSASAKARLALADNRAPEFSRWDPQTLHAILDEHPDIAEGLFSKADLAQIFAPATPEPAGDGEPAAVKAHEQWAVLVFLADEAEQQAFIERMQVEGRECRALMS